MKLFEAVHSTRIPGYVDGPRLGNLQLARLKMAYVKITWSPAPAEFRFASPFPSILQTYLNHQPHHVLQTTTDHATTKSP